MLLYYAIIPCSRLLPVRNQPKGKFTKFYFVCKRQKGDKGKPAKYKGGVVANKICMLQMSCVGLKASKPVNFSGRLPHLILGRWCV